MTRAGELGVQYTLVVDNGSDPAASDVFDKPLQVQPARVTFVRNAANLGSAVAYGQGLRQLAADPGCEYIWLLDDDNIPAHDALKVLAREYERLVVSTPRDRLAVLSLRQGRPYLEAIARGVQTPDEAFAKQSSFMGVDIRDLARKIRHRVRGNLGPQRGRCEQQCLSIQIPFGPYGGLFFHRDLLDAIGFPDSKFFLYADDIEYTGRISAVGGKMFLIPSSEIRDLEISGQASDRGMHIFDRLLRAASDISAFYSVRNQTYWYSRHWVSNRALQYVNALVFIAALVGFAICYNRIPRLLLVCRAIRDGYLGRLGRVSQLG